MKERHTAKDVVSVLDLLKGLRTKKQEHFGVIVLDAAMNVVGKKDLFIGGICCSTVDKRILYHYIINHYGVGCIIYHNHPSGNPEPSKQDIETTKSIEEGCETLGVKLLDHIIIGGYVGLDYFSFKMHNMIGGEQ